MKRRSRAVTLALLLCGLGMIALGLMRGEHLTVLEKAIKICLECIGIG